MSVHKIFVFKIYAYISFYVSDLIEEIRVYDEKQNEIKTDEDVSKRVKAYKKTSLNSSVHIFEEFLRKLEMTWKGKKIEISGKLCVIFPFHYNLIR